MGSYYVMKEMPDLNGTGERILYPQFAQIEQTTTQKLAESICGKSTFTTGEIEGLIRMIAQELAYELADGHSVKLDGIGVFYNEFITGKSVKSPEEVTAKLIKGIRPAFSPEYSIVNGVCDAVSKLAGIDGTKVFCVSLCLFSDSFQRTQHSVVHFCKHLRGIVVECYAAKVFTHALSPTVPTRHRSFH